MTDAEIVKWLADNVVYLEHKVGGKLPQEAKVGGWWPQEEDSVADTYPELRGLGLIEYIKSVPK